MTFLSLTASADAFVASDNEEKSVQVHTLVQLTNREINATKRELSASDCRKLTKFARSEAKQNQTTVIEQSLEEFRTLSEHVSFCQKRAVNVDEKRVRRHIAYLEKEHLHFCKKVHDTTDKRKFKFALLSEV